MELDRLLHRNYGSDHMAQLDQEGFASSKLSETELPQ